MELHPIVDSVRSPLKDDLWYVLSPDGGGTTAPSQRVGSALIQAGEALYLIGGADPNGANADVFQLPLTLGATWKHINTTGLNPRYEHATFKSALSPSQVFVFGGAHMDGNLNTIQVLDVEQKSWETVKTAGTTPMARTYHMNENASDKDSFYVFSGGETGSQPVGDQQLHCFDLSTSVWRRLDTVGGGTNIPPKRRHGHSLVTVEGKVIVFGGMAGQTFYNDLSYYDVQSKTWTTVKTSKKNWPSERAAHGAVVIGSSVVVFGGMNSGGALNDLWILDTNNWKWQEYQIQGPPPAPRLDFAMTVVEIPTSKDGSNANLNQGQTVSEDNDPSASTSTSTDTSIPVESSGTASTTRSGTSNNSDFSLRLQTVLSAEDDEGIFNQISTQTCTYQEPSSQSASDNDITCNDSIKINSKIIMIMGGMDTEGEIFDDCMMISLKPM